MDGASSARQLVEFLAAVSAYPDERSALLGATERAAVAVGADVAALVINGAVVAAVGFPFGQVPIDRVHAAVRANPGTMEWAGVGTCAVIVVPVEDHAGSLVMARRSHPFANEERLLVEGMSHVMTLARRLFRVIDHERAQVEENARLLGTIQERQSFLERLFKIQRSISHRAPIETVLDAVTEGAAELLGDEVVGLRLLDPDDPSVVRLVSTVGVEDDLLASMRRTPVGQGVGGLAIAEGRLITAEHYSLSARPLPAFVARGLTAAMAAPVRQNGHVVGSLTVASYRPGRRYTATEQEMLLAFAEHASLALNDASAVDAMRKAFGDAVHQATHDALTGLPSRSLVIDRLDHALARAERDQRHLGVIFVDLDRFKVVNDSLGHAVGDEVLIRVADRLLAAVRPGDTVGRLAGDEFVVICEGLEGDDVQSVARRVAEAVAVPIPLYGRETVITASIGIAESGRGTGRQRADELLRDADVAMYRAKERGRSRIELFDQVMRTTMLERLETEHALRRAITRNEFCLHYQPTLSVADGRVTSLEALIRWDHPDRGLVPPDQFIPLAEENGLIVPIGAWALRQACVQLAAWRLEHPALAQLQVSVNLSARQFTDPRLGELVTSSLAESGLPPDALWLEITESVLMDEAASTLDTLRALRRLGVHLAIDDFGTGYSSLSYLKRFDVDVLKIDRSFVDGLGIDQEDEAIVTAVVSLAHALGLSVTAEGVETNRQLAGLRRLGCDAVQGYLLGRPLPPEDLITALIPPRPTFATCYSPSHAGARSSR